MWWLLFDKSGFLPIWYAGHENFYLNQGILEDIDSEDLASKPRALYQVFVENVNLTLSTRSKYTLFIVFLEWKAWKTFINIQILRTELNEMFEDMKALHTDTAAFSSVMPVYVLSSSL